MKINKKIGVFIIGFALILPGCNKDFLVQKNTTDATEESLFKNSNDAVQLVNGIYDTFHNNDFLIKALWYQANFLTQDYKNWGSDVFFATYEIPTNFGALNTFWIRSYQGIARANSVFTIVDKMKNEGILTEDLAKRLKGEALFLRGVFYYYLASEFGGVPLELATVADDGRHPRNTQDEVFASVAADMQAASELLPWQQDLNPLDIGRATKGAALAYLGDAQMWLKDYTKAAATYESLTGHYQLEENFLDIHDFTNQNGKECIFAIQYIAGAAMNQQHTNDNQWLVTFCLPEEISQTGYAYVDKKYYDSFEPGDQRKFATVIGPGDENPDPKIDISNYQLVKQNWGGINTCGTIDHPWKGKDGLRSGYYSMKSWRDPNVTGNVGNPPYIYSSLDMILMRYGQVLLSKAECLFRTGNESGARDIINNQIRRRAGLPAAPPSMDFMTLLTEEYRHELGGEFSVFFLLRRAGVAISFVKDHYNIVIPPGHDLMPIPVSQIATNQTLVQNSGY